MIRRSLSLLLLVTILLQLVPAVIPMATAETASVNTSVDIAAPPDMKLTGRTDYTITEGVTESHLFYNDDSCNNQVAGFMTIIEPDAKVTFKASYKGYYTVGSTPESRAETAKDLPWGLQRTTAQAAAYEAATGEKVLFATNADFYNVNTYQPIGHLIMEGNILQTFGMSRKQPYFAVLKDGSFAIRDFHTPYTDVLEAVSGCWLIMDGENVTDTYYHSEGYHSNNPMNAIGLTADGRVITFVADGRQAPYSVGMDLHHLAELFLSMGCVNAIDLDGGGSATYASVHQGESELVLRNSPSDGSERAIANALLLVSTKGECDHNYSKNYLIKNDGTHDVSCTSCGKTINVGHSYTEGTCLCGHKEAQDDYLFFDFGNGSADRERYCQASYGYWNFDTAAGAQWSPVPWKGTYITWNKNEPVQIDPEGGTLIAAKSSENTNSYFYVTTIPDLHYKPERADYLQIRLCLSGFDDANEKSRFSLNYYKNGSTVQYTDGAFYSFEEGTVFDGTYMTLTLPINDDFRNSETISGIKLNFWNLEGLGTATFDYIYIGPREPLPSQKQLYFDFGNTEADQKRYEKKSYLGQSFDEASAWYGTLLSGNIREEPQVDYNEGTISLTKSAENTYSYFYLMTNSNLDYIPENAEFLQMRLKISGFDPTGPKTRFAMNYYKNGENTQYMDGATYSFAEGTVFDGTYRTLTLPITDEFRNSGSIRDIKLNFWSLGGTGSVVFDYIYIGPEDTLPTQDYLYFDFKDTGADRTRYSTKTYSFQNFDQASLWTGTWLIGRGRDTVESNQAEGTMTLTKSPDNTLSYTYLMTSGDLHFEPKNAQVLQLRLKLFGFDATNEKSRFALNYYKDGDSTQYMDGAVYSFEKGTVFDNSYLIWTLPLSEDFRNSEFIRGIKLNFWNLNGLGTVVFDHVYIGPISNIPIPSYTVVFQNEDGSTLLTQSVHKGESAAYTGAVPTKAYDSNSHYTFIGWDKTPGIITADTVYTAQFTATAHSYTYASLNALSHTVACEGCEFSEEAFHCYIDGICICREPEPMDPIVDTDLKIGHTLNLASDISINFAVAKTALDGFDLSTVYAESILTTYIGNEETSITATKLLPVENGNYYYFTLSGLTAVQMNDRIITTIYGIKDGQLYYSPTDDYSIADYAYSQLNKAAVSESLKILCTDLLRYGAKAQIFKAYRTDALADSKMTEEQRAFLSDAEEITFGNHNTVLNDLGTPGIQWKGKVLDLASKVTVKFIFSMGTYTGDLGNLTLRVSYEDIYGNAKTLSLTNGEVYNADYGYYAFALDTLLAAELRSVLSVQIYEGNTPVSNTLHYSADTYGNNKTGELLALCKALFAYSDSARSYFAN